MTQRFKSDKVFIVNIKGDEGCYQSLMSTNFLNYNLFLMY